MSTIFSAECFINRVLSLPMEEPYQAGNTRDKLNMKRTSVSLKTSKGFPMSRNIEDVVGKIIAKGETRNSK